MAIKTDEFKTQYENELIYQEINSNKHTLKGFMWFLVGIGFVWILTITGFFEVDKYMVSIAFWSAFLLFLPTLVIFLKGNLKSTSLKYYLLTLLCIVSGVVVTILSYHAVFLYVIPLLYAIQYRKHKVIWFTYIMNTITMLISSILSFYYGICDLNLLLQSQHVRNWYLAATVDGTLIIPFNENPIFIIIVFEVFPRSIILLVFAVMLQYTVISNHKDAVRIAELTYLKETDTKTRYLTKTSITK